MKFTPYPFLVFILFFTNVQSQTILSGTIKNSKGDNLSGATVTVSKDSTGAILSYGIAGTDGDFRITLNAEIKTVFLKVSYIGYATWIKQIKNADQQLEVVLRESSEELKEVMVETSIIQQRGDTLTFRVSAFMDQKDRVISDVLRKMPGIEIMPGGQIRYQGEPIRKYYIEGLDLLEGRYSLANNNISEISPPPFEQERWLDNNVHLGSVNYLIRLKKDVDLKMNLSYLNDSQEQIGSIQTKIFTPTDTIDLVESIHIELFTNTLQSRFTLEQNTNDNYLKNELEINGYWDSRRGDIVTPEEEIQQKLSNPFSVIRNKLRMLKLVGKQLITFRSNSGYTEANQRLVVNPGQFPDLLNEGEPYAEMEQSIASSAFFTDNSAGFTKGIKDFTIAPETGFSIRKQQLDSRLAVTDKGTAEFPDGNFRNILNFLSSRFYFTSTLNYKRNNWNIRLTTPVNYRSFDIEDAYLREAQDLDRLTFEPNLFIKKEFSAYWESSISANLSNDFSDFRSMYNGFILNSYRNIQRYNSPLPESFSQFYSARVAYRNPLKSLFANASYTYGTTDNNLLFSNLIQENGAILFEAFEKENTSISRNLRVAGSKYFNKISTTLDLGSSFSFSQREQLLNSELVQVNNQNLRFTMGLESEVADWLSSSYTGNFSLFETALAGSDFDEIISQEHLLNLSFFPADNQHFSIESEYYYNNLSEEISNSYFLNLEYQYTFEERKVDLAITWNNVLGTEEFVNVSNNEFSYVESTYRLRPIQLLMSLKFTF